MQLANTVLCINELFSKYILSFSVPPQPALSVYSHDDSGDLMTDIREGRQSYVDCTSPATTPDDDVSLTVYKDAQNMNCYKVTLNVPGMYLSDESGHSQSWKV